MLENNNIHIFSVQLVNIVSWKRLISFVALDGKTYRGKPIIKDTDDLGQLFAYNHRKL
ncbi:hypothetical protein V1527DRAFT_465640 [Lipomyces starkeyi]